MATKESVNELIAGLANDAPEAFAWEKYRLRITIKLCS